MIPSTNDKTSMNDDVNKKDDDETHSQNTINQTNEHKDTQEQIIEHNIVQVHTLSILSIRLVHLKLTENNYFNICLGSTGI